MTLQAVGEPNPALKYMLLPPGTDLTEEDALPLYYSGVDHIGHKLDDQKQLERVEQLLKEPIQDLPKDEVRKILKEYASMLKHVEIAARRTQIHWDLGVDKLGYEVLLPSLSRWRSTNKLIALQAQLAIVEGRYDDAIHSLQTGYAMARHVAEGPTLIQALVGAAIADLMTQQVEPLMQGANAPNLYWALATLPKPLLDLRRSIEFERVLLYISLPELQHARSGKLTTQQWQELPERVAAILDAGEPEERKGNWWNRAGLAGIAAKLYPEARQYWLKHGLTEVQIQAMPVQQVIFTYSLTQYDQIRDDLTKWFSLPYWQAARGLAAAERRFEDSDQRHGGAPFTYFLPSLAKAYGRLVAMDEHIAALQSIEAVRMYAANHGGQLPQSLDRIEEAPVPRNPVTGQFFEYRVEDNRFVLEAPAPDATREEGTRYEVTINR